MTMPDQPPQGSPEEPQGPQNAPPPSQPYYPLAYPQQGGENPAYPPYAQPSQPYNPNQPPPGYPPPSQPYYPNSAMPNQPPGYPPPAGYPQPGQTGFPPPAWPPQGSGQPFTGQPGYPPGFAPSLTPVPPKNNTLRNIIIGGVAAFLVLVVAAAVAFSSGKGGTSSTTGSTGSTTQPTQVVATDTPVDTAPSGFTTYTATDGTYKIQYPSDWSTQTDNAQDIQGEDFLSSDGNSVLSVYNFSGFVPTSKFSQVLQALLQKATNVSVSPKVSSVKLGSNIWNKESATFTVQGINGVATVYGTNHAGKTTLIFDLTPVSEATSVNKQAFLPMIKSFTYLS